MELAKSTTRADSMASKPKFNFVYGLQMVPRYMVDWCREKYSIAYKNVYARGLNPAFVLGSRAFGDLPVTYCHGVASVGSA